MAVETGASPLSRLAQESQDGNQDFSGGFWAAVLRVAERFGVPVGILVVMFAGIWYSGSWMATNVVTPLVSRHMKFLDVSEETQKALIKTQDQISNGMSEFRDGQVETQKKIDLMIEEQRRLNTALIPKRSDELKQE